MCCSLNGAQCSCETQHNIKPLFKSAASVHLHCIRLQRHRLSAWPDTAVGACLLGTGRSGTARQLSSPSCDTARHMSGITEEADRQHGQPQLSSTGGSAMRAMHDSSSSWTDSSLPPKAKAAAKQQGAGADIHTADADTGQTKHVQESVVPDVAVDMLRSTVVCLDQAMMARPDAGVAVVTAPENGMSLLVLIVSCISNAEQKWLMLLRLATLQPVCAVNTMLPHPIFLGRQAWTHKWPEMHIDQCLELGNS